MYLLHHKLFCCQVCIFIDSSCCKWEFWHKSTPYRPAAKLETRCRCIYEFFCCCSRQFVTAALRDNRSLSRSNGETLMFECFTWWEMRTREEAAAKPGWTPAAAGSIRLVFSCESNIKPSNLNIVNFKSSSFFDLFQRSCFSELFQNICGFNVVSSDNTDVTT